jgi:hypothetical protein
VETKDEIFMYSKIILRELMPLAPLRLMGIRISDLILKENLENQGLERYMKNSNKSKENTRPFGDSKKSEYKTRIFGAAVS